MCFLSWNEAQQRRSLPPLVTCEGGRNVVWLVGEQDVATVPLLIEALAEVAARDKADMVIDLSGTCFVDAATLGAFVTARLGLGAEARVLSLRGPPAFTRRVIDICGLTDMVDPARPDESAGPSGSSALTTNPSGGR
jgi:anti-anti-sigma factor